MSVTIMEMEQHLRIKQIELKSIFEKIESTKVLNKALVRKHKVANNEIKAINVGRPTPIRANVYMF